MEKYELLELIGKGNFGSAHKVREKATGRVMVIKKVRMTEMTKQERDNAMNEVRLECSGPIRTHACSASFGSTSYVICECVFSSR